MATVSREKSASFTTSDGVPIRQIVALLLVGCLSLISISVWHIQDSYRHQQAQTRQAASNLSRSLLNEAELAITHAATILAGVHERLDSPRLGSLDELLEIARLQARNFAEIQDIMVLDRNGNWLFSTAGLTPGMNYADRAYFQHHRQHPGPGVHVGAPVRSRIDNSWLWTVTRRIDDADGNFAGVAVVALSGKAFLQHFQALDLGANAVIDLVRRDGTLLLRAPLLEEAFSKGPLQGPIYELVASGNREGVSTVTSPLDGISRIVSYHASDTQPIYTIVGIDPSEALSQWRRQAMTLGLTLVFTLAVIAFLTRNLMVSLQARQRAEEQLRQACRNLRKTNQSLAALAAQDGLTGLANRRQFNVMLDRYFGLAARQGEPLALIMMDVDDFKHFNDTFGHQGGDTCLRRIAECLPQHLHRPTDLAARYGGEELAILLPNTDEAGALKVAEHIRQAVFDLHLSNPRSLHGRVTLSIGVASCVPSACCPTARDLLQKADAALYQAKRNGKNCAVVSAIPLPA